MNGVRLLGIGLALLLAAAAQPLPAQPRVGTLEADVSLDILNVVMDAPWRVWLRPGRAHYVPVTIFFPETKADWRRVQVLEIALKDGDAPESPALFWDAHDRGPAVGGATSTGLSGEGIKLMDGFGRTTSDLDLVSPVEPPQGPNAPWQVAEIHDGNRGWHTILIVPIPEEVSARGASVIHLVASVRYKRLDGPFQTEHTVRRRLEIALDPNPWPSFEGWRSFDTHVHTIAEFSSELTYKALRKNYGGPVRMLFESAYALGFIDDPDNAGDRIITTDHNNYYSDRDHPHYGPTTEGIGPGPIQLKHPEYSHYFIDRHGKLIAEGQKEFENYNDLIGITRGEELSLAKHPGTLGAMIGSLSAHLLLFSARNFVGPFHGGSFLFWRDEPNPNQLDWVLGQVTHDPNFPLGFAYAAHPFSRSRLAQRFDTVWQDSHFDVALRGDFIRKVNGVERDFVFKGFELWNEKDSRYVELSIAQAPMIRSLLEDPSKNDRWKRGEPNWDDSLQYSLSRWHEFLAGGMATANPEREDVKFVRKLFIVAGSDAHGDFNRRSDVAGRGFSSMPSILLRLFKFFWMTDNAFGKVRTVVDATSLVHPSATNEQQRALLALAHGQGVLTDGPVLDFKLDSDGHFDARTQTWHEELRYENDEGRIGGDGALDGGRTALVAAGSAEPMMRYRWNGSSSFGGDLERIEVYLDTPGKPVKLVQVKRNTGKAEVLEPTALADPRSPADADGWREAVVSRLKGARGPLGALKLSSALSLGGFTKRGELPPFDFRCYTNPVWTLPVHAQTHVNLSGAQVPAGGLRVSFRFPISMRPEAAVAKLVPIDAQGQASGPGIALTPAQPAHAGWSRNAREGIADALLTVTNATSAVDVTTAADGHSFVVILDSLSDAHGNRLNAVAWRVKI
ncbi:MAG: hypothetical protein HYY25_07105 [Candidatus Wallbacteria bacterium]|nr:hypothetical protein [Candidatus Wallbacteria bacterium]